jgi:hypothetical protein
MAENAQILSALRKLTAYYGKGLSKEQTEMYLEMLAEVKPTALDYAVQTDHALIFPAHNDCSKPLQNTPSPAEPAQVFTCQRQLNGFSRRGLMRSDGGLAKIPNDTTASTPEAAENLQNYQACSQKREISGQAYFKYQTEIQRRR